MIDLKIVSCPLDVGAAVSAVTSPRCGAISVFVGTTREHTDDGCRPVKALFYEAYESMALNEMESITVLVKRKCPEVTNIAIHHRLDKWFSTTFRKLSPAKGRSVFHRTSSGGGPLLWKILNFGYKKRGRNAKLKKN